MTLEEAEETIAALEREAKEKDSVILDLNGEIEALTERIEEMRKSVDLAQDRLNEAMSIAKR